MLPRIKANWSITFSQDGTGLLTIHDKTLDIRKFCRYHNNGTIRWKICCGRWVKASVVVKSLFEFRKDVTDEEIDYMESFVDGIEQAMDAVITEMLDERIKKNRAGLYLHNNQISKSRNESSFVYLMRHTNGLTKIGWSRNPEAREKTLQAEDPRLEMIWHTSAKKEVERQLHDIFASVRVRGEWFKLEPHHIDWIQHIVT